MYFSEIISFMFKFLKIGRQKFQIGIEKKSSKIWNWYFIQNGF